VLTGGIVAALLVAGIVAGVVVRRRSHDDAHSVEHYHRKLHTLEEIRAHPHAVGGVAPVNGNGHAAANGSNNGDGDGDANESGTVGEDATDGHASYPASAVRIAGSSSVRLTDPSQVTSTVPPISPPPLANSSEPVTFDDAGPDPIPTTFMNGN